MIRNPNHIGCHTLGESESFFTGTQEIERELIAFIQKIFSKETRIIGMYMVLLVEQKHHIQAFWICRYLFLKDYGADLNEICNIVSKDGHYSMYTSWTCHIHFSDE